MDSVFSNNDIKKKLELLRKGEIKVEDNVKYFLNRIKKYNKDYNIYLEVDEEGVLKRAKELDQKLQNKENLGKLFGLCFSVKSNINVKGLTISCASKTLENYKGTYDADVIRKIKNEDGIILGIVNNDEFACGSSGETSAFGPTINPKSPKRIPGGSSSGSAASVSLDLCDISLGSDTGGSIRNPASHCGVIGIKPTYGRVSRFGLIDLSMSLDQIGPLSKDIYGSALTLEVISGYSENDSVTFDKDVDNYTSISLRENYNIGIIKEFEDMIIDKEIKDIYLNLIEKLKQKYNIKEISVKNINLAVQTYYPIVYTEFFSGTRKFDGIKYGKKIEETCGEEVLRRILGGMEISRSEYEGTYYRKALSVKNSITKQLKEYFKELDFIVAPVTPKLPHKLGEKLSVKEIYGYDAFTIPANLSGIPAGVINFKDVKIGDENLSVGIQVLVNSFNEKTLIEGLEVLNKLKYE